MEERITESIVGQIRRIRVLHVDDDPQFATLVRQFLERQDDTLEVESETGGARFEIRGGRAATPGALTRFVGPRQGRKKRPHGRPQHWCDAPLATASAVRRGLFGRMTRSWRGRSPGIWALLGLLVFLGVRAVLGGAALVLDPSGASLGLSTAALAGSPFRDFLVPGISLLAVVGGGSFAVAAALLKCRPWAPVGAVLVGLVLVVWVLVEGLVVGFGERFQYPNLVLGIVLVALGTAVTWRGYPDR